MKKVAIVLSLAAALLSSACKQEQGAPAGASSAKPQAAAEDPHEGLEARPLQPGDAAPDVTFTLQDGKQVSLASLKGKQVLVYFYPKDDTPGCTIEAEGLRDGWAQIQAAGLEIYGVSTQGKDSHQAFIDKHKLPFPLVVDESGKVTQAFRVPTRNGYAARQSFLIGKDGKIKQVWLEVDPKEHAATVIAAAKG